MNKEKEIKCNFSNVEECRLASNQEHLTISCDGLKDKIGCPFWRVK